MEYRENRRTGDKVSILGMGSGAISRKGEKNGIETLEYAVEKGINYFDLAAAEGDAFPIFGAALSGVRKDVMFQIHFGADYDTGYREAAEEGKAESLMAYSVGDYGKTMEPDRIKRSVDWQLTTLKTDYIDYGFIHCVDELSNWEEYKEKGIYDLMCEYKKQGVIRHLALSSHTPHVAQTILDEADVDMLMFSINPAYDYHRHEKYGAGTTDERSELYRRCERDGIGITVMKPYAAGMLLDENMSVFGRALTTVQCIQYALDVPGVLTVLPGIGSVQEVDELVRYLDATEEEKDYSVISSITPEEAMGKCVYCNHCEPCPAGINIGNVNKYYDLSRLGDDMARSHYEELDRHASDCVRCGHCNSSCPFKVEQMERMEEIAAYFGR